MGQTGSDTRKASIRSTFLLFTKWTSKEMMGLFQRSQMTLSDTFALRQAEFEFLLGRDLVSFVVTRDMFTAVLDTDKNKLVDKFETVTLITLLSSLTNAEKVEFFFELLNFNDKGYLTRSELSLLMRTLTVAAQKADPLIKAPTVSLMQDLITIAFDQFCRVDPRHEALRKPELVKFAAEVVEVQRYLDAWRGHASQVLLPKREKWRDLFFPCNEASIAPSHEWFQIIDAPPAHFVYWRRKEDVECTGMDGSVDTKSTGGARVLFTHKTGTIKSVDKRKRYSGPGAVGNGLLVQGLLADRWLLNGLNAVISRPPILPFLFAPTEQESIGRFCVRFFEGAGWRSVFVDDRIPCAPDFQPLFARSSDPSECWPLVLEKALAKYMGSYGQVGLCSTRIDAAESALRLFSGGHVSRMPCADFKWTSVSSDVDAFANERDGFHFVSKLRAEGSIVAFGRSESLAMHNSTLKHSPRKAVPHGFLFPVVNMYTREEDGYKVLVVRDGFGHLVPPKPGSAVYDEKVADEASGHCHIYALRAEDLQDTFDTLVICRFPDALRIGADRLGWRQWHTTIVKDRSAGPAAPAKFALSVSALPPPPPKPRRLKSQRLSRMRQRASDTAVSEEDVVEQSMFKSFDYNRPRMVPGEVGTAPQVDEDEDESEREEDEEGEGEGKEEEEHKGESIGAGNGKSNGKSKGKSKGEDASGDQEERPTSLAFTISSSCEWAVGGSSQAGAQLRLRLVPSIPTLRALRLREAERVAKGQRRLAAIAEQKRRQAELLAARDEGNEGSQEQLTAPNKDPEKVKGESKEEKPLAGLAGAGVIGLGAVPPDSSGDISPTLPPVLPRATFADKERELCAKFYETRVGARRCWVSQSLELWPGDYYLTADVSYALPTEQLLRLTEPSDPAEAPWLDNRPHTVDEVWLQVSSVAPFAVKAVSADECPRYAASVTSVAVPPETFPFSFETAKEASSRGVEAILARLKTQAEQIDVEYAATRSTLKRIYKAGKRANLIG